MDLQPDGLGEAEEAEQDHSLRDCQLGGGGKDGLSAVKGRIAPLRAI